MDLWIPQRLKRTMPFQEQCQFLSVEGDLVTRCEFPADWGLYFGNDYRVNAISLCLYHLVNQESLWRRGAQ